MPKVLLYPICWLWMIEWNPSFMLSGSKLKFQGIEFIWEHLNAQGPDPLLEQWRKWLKVTASPAVSWNIVFGLGFGASFLTPQGCCLIQSSSGSEMEVVASGNRTKGKWANWTKEGYLHRAWGQQKTPYKYFFVQSSILSQSLLSDWRAIVVVQCLFSSLECSSWTVFTRLHDMPEKVLRLSISIKSFVSIVYPLAAAAGLQWQSCADVSIPKHACTRAQIGTANLQLFEHASTLPMDFNSVESWDVITACRMASDLFSTRQCRANWQSVCWQCRCYVALLASMRLCWVMLWILLVAEAPTEIQTLSNVHLFQICIIQSILFDLYVLYIYI